MLVLDLEYFKEFLDILLQLCLIVKLSDEIILYSAGSGCKKCDRSFVCVYMKIICDGWFIDFVKICLNLLTIYQSNIAC